MMPMYRLHLNECGNRTDAAELTEATTVDQAYGLAITAAREIMAEEVKQGRLCLGCSIEIADAHGILVSAVRFQDALTITGSTVAN